MIDFKSLETAVWVARLESFKAAAAKLNTTQPAISVRIAQLEDLLGVRLFNRTNRSFALTPSGRRLIDYADRLLRLRAEMIHAVSDRSMTRGTFRLGVAETIVHSWLPRFLERMSGAYPKLELEIEVDISTHLRERLLRHEIDLAFLVGPISEPALVSKPLRQEPVRFIASPSLALSGTSVSLEEIAQRPILTFARNTQPHTHIVELFADPHFSRPRIYASSSLATLVRMALDGIGIAVIPPVIVDAELKSGRLIELQTAAVLPDLPFFAAWLITPERRTIEGIAEIAAEIAGS